MDARHLEPRNVVDVYRRCRAAQLDLTGLASHEAQFHAMEERTRRRERINRAWVRAVRQRAEREGWTRETPICQRYLAIYERFKRVAETLASDCQDYHAQFVKPVKARIDFLLHIPWFHAASFGAERLRHALDGLPREWLRKETVVRLSGKVGEPVHYGSLPLGQPAWRRYAGMWGRRDGGILRIVRRTPKGQFVTLQWLDKGRWGAAERVRVRMQQAVPLSAHQVRALDAVA